MNDIHPTSIIEGNVKFGKGNKILPYTIIYGPTEIGDNNIIGPHAVIGTPGQDTRDRYYDSSNAFIKIGNNNIIREFCAVQKPRYEDVTLLGDEIYLMQSVHIPHDAIISNKVVITPMCALAGITRILEGANLGMGATISQYCVIGHYSIVATGAAVTKNVRPFSRYIPGKPISINEYLIKKYSFEDNIDEITRYVIEGEKPVSQPIQNIIFEFEKLHKLSKMKMY